MTAAEIGKKVAVILSKGTYRLAPGRRILRAPAVPRPEEVSTEAVPEEEFIQSREAAAVVEAPPPPTLEEIARQEADAIVEAARREAEDVRRQAREQGYADGLKEGVEQGKAQGRAEALEELRNTLERWLTMGDTLTEAWRARFDGLEEEVKDLAVTAAERLVDRQLELAPEAVLEVVRDSMRHAAEAESVTLLVSPRDVALVRGAKEELAGMLKGTGRFDIQEDPKVAPGGCTVVTKTQLIDATRKTRSDVVRDAMRRKGEQHAD